MGEVMHTCQCPARKEGDGMKAGVGCSWVDGCADKQCAELPSNGAGVAPQCSSANGVGTCENCPPGYQSQPRQNKCQDADDCSTGMAACGPAATRCIEGKKGSGAFTCQCASSFKLVNANGIPFCMLDSGNTIPQQDLNKCATTANMDEAKFKKQLTSVCKGLGGSDDCKFCQEAGQPSECK